MNDIQTELEMASSVFGPLADEYRAKLRDFYEEPTPEKWARCQGIILSPSGGPGFVTLWKALLAVDPGNTPRSGPAYKTGEPVRWEWCPTREAIAQALCYATH